jgi:hypothetical protein
MKEELNKGIDTSVTLIYDRKKGVRCCQDCLTYSITEYWQEPLLSQ